MRLLYPDAYPSLQSCFRHATNLVSIDVIQAYYGSLMKHIGAVQQAGHDLGVSQSQLEEHDLSKFTHVEFNAYALHFHGGGAPAAFAKAWNHHLHNNAHHWQHFMFADGFNLKDAGIENGCLEMPENYMLEMVADWMGASHAYTGSYDMTDWLRKNLYKVRVHSRTATYLASVLIGLGYKVVATEYQLKSGEVVDAKNE